MKFIIIGLLFLSISNWGFSNDSIVDETIQIRNTISNYFDGVRLADEKLLNNAFHLNSGHMKGFLVKGKDKSKVTARPIKEVISKWIAREPRPEMTGQILSIEVFGAAATVTFDFDNKYLDFFHLAKTSDGWKIVNKFYIYK